jgi:hypothetical protein
MLHLVALQGLREPDGLVETTVLCPHEVCVELFHPGGVNRLEVLEVGMRGDVPLRVHHIHRRLHILRELVAMLDLLCHGDEGHRLGTHGVH